MGGSGGLLQALEGLQAVESTMQGVGGKAGGRAHLRQLATHLGQAIHTTQAAAGATRLAASTNGSTGSNATTS